MWQWWVQNAEAVKNLLLVVGGIVGIYLAWLRVTAANRQAEATARQADIGRRAHFAELYTDAVKQLSDDKLEVRLAAIYTLRQLGRDFPDFGEIVFELFNAYLTHHPRAYPIDEMPPDVREILRILQEQSEITHGNDGPA